MNARPILIADDVLGVLSGAIIEGPRLMLTGQLDRKLYVETNKVLEAAGGKWNRSAKAHVFDGDAAEVIEPIILTGTYTRTKQDFGQFDTPDELAGKLVDMACIRAEITVLEPSAGVGNIVRAIRKTYARIHAIEIDINRYSILSTVVPWRVPDIAEHADFLRLTPTPKYDRVVMNPPFARQEDIRHVSHAMRFLKPGGRLVSVMSAAVMFRTDRRATDFREMVAGKCATIERLPEGTFRESGTMVNSCVVTIQL